MREPVESIPTYDLTDLEPETRPPTPDVEIEPRREPEQYPRNPFDEAIDVLVWIVSRILKWTGLSVVLAVVLIVISMAVSAVVILPQYWVNNYETAFMADNENGTVIRQWVDMDHISRNAVAAAMVLEDVQIGNRALAFDVPAYIATTKAWLKDRNVEGGSTIPQQLVKNLYLSPSRNPLRKVVEVPLSMTASLMLSDERILELYLNYAQFGTRIYGVCAASWYYFNTPPWSMSEFEAAQLLAVLTFPSEARRADETGIYVLGPKSSAKFEEKVYIKAPQDLAWVGGYAPLMEQVGIEGTAADYANSRGDDSCSTMPDAVRTLLISEGYSF